PRADADRTAEARGQGAVHPAQNPGQQRQSGGDKQLPPQYGTNRLAQQAGTFNFSSRPRQNVEIILGTRTTGQRAALQNSIIGVSGAFSTAGRGDRVPNS